MRKERVLNKGRSEEKALSVVMGNIVVFSYDSCMPVLSF